MDMVDLLMQSPLASALPGLPAEQDAARVAVYAIDAAALLLVAGLVVHGGTMARLHLRAARARRLAGKRAVETTALSVGQACRIEVCGDAGPPCGAVLREVEGRHLTLELDPVGAAPRAGTPIVVTAVGRSAAFRFPSVVRDVRGPAGSRTLHLSRPPWVEKVQRRDFFRVPIDTPTSVAARTPTSPDAILVACRLTDLSAGGVRLLSPLPLEAGAALAVRVPTSMDAETRFEARVRRCSPSQPGGDQFEVGCEFERIDEEARTRLLCHCFDLERLARRDRRDGG